MLTPIPSMGSALPFPIPWKDIPANIYMAIRMIAAILYMPEVTAKQTYLKEHGLAHPIDFINMHRDDAPWITQTTPGASVPIEVIPANVSAVGPITISVAPVEEQDPELAQWLARRPTVFVNLGSSVKYNEARAKIMAEAVLNVLEQDKYIQVLWSVPNEPWPAIPGMFEPLVFYTNILCTLSGKWLRRATTRMSTGSLCRPISIVAG